MENDSDELTLTVDVREAARLLGVSEASIRRSIRAKRLRTLDLGPRVLRIPRSAIDALIAGERAP